METINNRFNLSRVFTYVALGAMIVATIFKMMHLNGADEALLLSFAALGVSLLTGSVSGVYYNRDKKGMLRVLGVVVGIVLLIIAYAFKILHMPGADQVLILSVTVLFITMLANTLYVYNNASGNGNLFTFLHEKYSAGIERFLLILTALVVCFGLLKLFGDGRRDFVSMIHLVAIYGAAFQLIALAWRAIEQDLSSRNTINLVILVGAFTSLCLPMLTDVVDFRVRLVAVMFFSVATAILAFRMDRERNISSYIACFAAAVFVGIGLAKFGIAPILMPTIPVSIIIIIAMIVGILLSAKNSITRMYLILCLAGYFLEIRV